MPNTTPFRRYLIARRLLAGDAMQAIASELEVPLHRVQSAWKLAFKPIFARHFDEGIESEAFGRTLNTMRKHADYWTEELDREYGNRASHSSPLLPCCWCAKHPTVQRHPKDDLYRLIHTCEVVNMTGIEDWMPVESLLERWNTRRGTPPTQES